MELNNCTVESHYLSFGHLPMIVMLGRISIGYFIFNIRTEPMILIGTATTSFIAIAHTATHGMTFYNLFAIKYLKRFPVHINRRQYRFLNWRMDGVRHYSNDDLLWFEVD